MLSTPVAELEPVQLAGTIVQRASLHNAEEIERKDIRIGDVVVVEKAGKIIPHIVRVEKHERQQKLEPFEFPKKCPACDSKVVKDEGGVYIRCPNQFCPAQVKERIRYFASRSAMDIEGLGDKIVDQLVVESKMVKHYADLYDLTEHDFTSLERMGPRSAQKLLSAIQNSKQQSLARVLNGLSIRHVGNRVATILADEFGSIDKLREASVEQISEIHEIGDTIAQSVFDYFHDEFGKKEIEGLRAAGVSLTQNAKSNSTAPGPLTGKSLVVTGKLVKYTRDEIHELIETNGGRAASTVSSKTDYLIAGEKAGSKLQKAEKLGVIVLSEDDFHALITNQ